MRTVLIYKGAGDKKTQGDEGDASIWSDLRDAVRGESLAAARASNPAAATKELGNKARALLEDAAKNALTRTYLAIIEENEKNDEARGPVGQPEPPSPGKSRVDEAYSKQLDDIKAIIDKRMAS
jgi:hypothetical protein